VGEHCPIALKSGGGASALPAPYLVPPLMLESMRPTVQSNNGLCVTGGYLGVRRVSLPVIMMQQILLLTTLHVDDDVAKFIFTHRGHSISMSMDCMVLSVCSQPAAAPVCASL